MSESRSLINMSMHASCYRICCLAIVMAAVSCKPSAERGDSQNLFRSSEFTPAGSFTSGAEGPAVDENGNLYAVNFAHEGSIGRITSGGQAGIFAELPEGSTGNGIRFDSHGNMFIADYMGHKIYKVERFSNQLVIHADLTHMKQPNDLAIDGKDRLYASDPDWESGTGSIWRIDPDGSAILLEGDMGTVNGIEVSPDDETLYVNETVQRRVWAYDLSPEAEISNKRLLIEFPDHGLDGMRCDTSGNLYITRYGKGTVVEVSPEGRVLKEIALTGKNPSNLAFGGPGGRTVYVTVQDRGNIEKFHVDIPGREWMMFRKN
jgi:gluconolactonase